MEHDTDHALISVLLSILQCGQAGRAELAALRAVAKNAVANAENLALTRGAPLWLEEGQLAA